MKSIKKKPALVFKVLKTKFMWCEIKKTYLLMYNQAIFLPINLTQKMQNNKM